MVWCGPFDATLRINMLGTSLVAQWVRLCAPNAGGLGLIPGQVARFHMHATTNSSHATTKEPASQTKLRIPCATTKELESHY